MAETQERLKTAVDERLAVILVEGDPVRDVVSRQFSAYRFRCRVAEITG
jgi:hypothetical protein